MPPGALSRPGCRPARSNAPLVARNMAEDTAVAGDELYIVYESGAKKLADADRRVRTIHHGPLAELTP